MITYRLLDDSKVFKSSLSILPTRKDIHQCRCLWISGKVLSKWCDVSDGVKKFLRSTFLQLNIESLTESEINVLHHLAAQRLVLAFILQEIHCMSADKLIISIFVQAGFTLGRKHGFATSVLEQPKCSRLQTPTARPQSSDIPVFLHLCLSAGDFTSSHVA